MSVCHTESQAKGTVMLYVIHVAASIHTLRGQCRGGRLGRVVERSEPKRRGGSEM